MKNYVFIVITLLICLPINVFAVNKDEELIKNATSGLLMEESTGQIIYKKDINKRLSIASMTKMVAQTIILENIESGKIKWDDIVEASQNAADMGGSQIFLTAGEKMSVKDLFKGISMASANDATVCMAEYIAGSEEKFVKLMNEEVNKLGLKNTHFKNSTGLDEEGHYSSAYDMAVIARNLLKHKKILEFSSKYEDYLRKDSPNKFWLVNTNKLIRYFEGADGLKTGHTDNAKYCLAATAKKNNMRLIAIVLGEEESKVRNSETMELLDYGFNTKKVTILKEKDTTVKEINLDKSNKDKIKIKTETDLGVLQDKNTNAHKYTYKVKLNNIKLPLKKNTVVGKIKVYEKNNSVSDANLIIDEDINKLNYLELYLEMIKNTIIGKI